jgi:hypothetical protein
MVSKENGCDRAFVLFCTCMLTFGSYYVFDMPRYVLGTHITCTSLSSKILRATSHLTAPTPLPTPFPCL